VASVNRIVDAIYLAGGVLTLPAEVR